jgi:hypothetical protein
MRWLQGADCARRYACGGDRACCPKGGTEAARNPVKVALRAFSPPSPSLMLPLLVFPEFAFPLVRRPMTSVRSAALQTWLTTSRAAFTNAFWRRPITVVRRGARQVDEKRPALYLARAVGGPIRAGRRLHERVDRRMLQLAAGVNDLVKRIVPRSHFGGLSANPHGDVVSKFLRFEIRCPSVRPIERAMREPRMGPQSTVFPAQSCRP